ncbi:MAG TPA: EscU/YscU/HrcU family type III secretion system export apparatus switch protein [Bryobacterales bacterium]|nr:EscU/YscU/HrcU family type III secretion system export apparatus switch protein [Bryobacterales bacterium]
MSDLSQRTEQPTPRRLQEARREGQIPLSRDLTQAVQFAIAVAALGWAAGPLMDGLKQSQSGLLREAFRDGLEAGRVVGMITGLVRGPLAVVGWLGLLLVGASLVMHFLQTGFAITPKRLQFDFSRLSPLGRLRDLPAENVRETGKALLLFPLFGWACWAVVRQNLDVFLQLPRQPLGAATVLVGSSLENLLGKAALALVALGAWDYFRQRQSLLRKLRMTKQEVRQEQKDLEGNPLIKARFRRLQRELVRRRMMSRVPKSTVVITNPTHYAVALEYHLETMRAPVVTAKGQNYMAQRIRRVAESSGIPIVENPPLAQALYKSCEVGSEIPVALYRAVAEILAYIFRLTKRN